MTLSELKNFLYELVKSVFPDSNVIWSEQYAPQLSLPQTTLKLKDMTLPRHPINIINDGFISNYYECTKILEINQYIYSVEGNNKEIYSLENPAADDLNKLLMYLQSDEGVEVCHKSNFCIEGMGPIRDLSELDRTHYRYRAMQEYTMRFVIEYRNKKVSIHGQIDENNDSDQIFEKGPVGYFSSVEMEENYE